MSSGFIKTVWLSIQIPHSAKRLCKPCLNSHWWHWFLTYVRNIKAHYIWNDTYVGFGHWSFLAGIFVTHSREGNLRAQEEEPAVDVGTGFALTRPFRVTCRETTTTCRAAFQHMFHTNTDGDNRVVQEWVLKHCKCPCSGTNKGILILILIKTREWVSTLQLLVQVKDFG